MGIETLQAILKSPEQPRETPKQENWEEVVNRLSLPLPTDYRKYIELYGTGRIDKFLWILNPFSVNANLNLFEKVRVELDALRELQASGEFLPYPLFPEKGGLLPFGITDNGDVLHWLTRGAPDEWQVVVNESRAPEYEEFRLGLADFLAQILSRSAICRIFPRSFPSALPQFVPWP
jgi:hypothetical protein